MKGLIRKTLCIFCMLSLVGLCSCQCARGCGQLKDNILDSFNHWLTSVSHKALTPAASLMGERYFGEDFTGKLEVVCE